MKAVIKLCTLFIVVIAGTCITSEKVSAQVSVNFQLFYDDLSPYGYWVDNPTYGYVWVPNVDPGFTPYGTNGHWVFTDAGWTWFSDYSWGWAPFHYGRWYSDPTYGPMWVPGNEWGPGWVTWRQSEGYYGWAPIEPGVSINIAYGSGYHVADDRWIFVRDRDFGSTTINNYYVNSSNNTTIINNSTVINNTQVDNTSKVAYNAGPGRKEVQTRTGRTIAPVAVRESSKPGQQMTNGELQMYRPRVEKTNPAGQKPTPVKVANLKDVKPAAERTSSGQPQKENQQMKEQPAQKQNKDLPAKQQPSQQHNAQPAKQPPSQQQHQEQPAKQQPSQQHNAQPAKQPPSQQQHQEQPAKQQPSQQHNAQPAKQPPSQQQHQEQPAKQPPSQQQHQEQPAKQQPSQQHNSQPAKQQPSQQHNAQPAKQQPSQQQHRDQPAKEQPSQQQRDEQQKTNDLPKHSGSPDRPQQPDPSQNKEEEKNPH